MGDDFGGSWAIGSALTMPLVRALFRVRIVGMERVPATGAAILAFNHVSVLDGPVLAVETSFRRRRAIRFLVASEVFDHPVYGPVLRAFDQIPIRRGERDAGAVDRATETIRAGALAAIAPEGTVNPDAGAGMQRIRSGCARIAIATRAPVIPVGIWGTQERWPQRGPTFGRPWRRPLAVVFGPPILPHPDDDVAAFGSRLGSAIAEQVREARATRDRRR